MDERQFSIETDAVHLTNKGRTKQNYVFSICALCERLSSLCKGRGEGTERTAGRRRRTPAQRGGGARSDRQVRLETPSRDPAAGHRVPEMSGGGEKGKKTKQQRPSDQAEAALHSASSSSPCTVQRMELERQREKERADLDQINLGRTALLLERKQGRMNKTLRQQLDSTNAQLAQIQKEQ